MDDVRTAGTKRPALRKMRTGMPEKAPTKLMCADEVASKLKVCKATVYKMVKEGQLEAVHLGRLVRITPESYEAFLANRRA